MNLNLDDKKIIKITYRLNESDVVEFNYSDGELASVVPIKKSKMLSNSEMINKIKNTSLFQDVKAAHDLINMDLNGSLDKIASRHRDEIQDKLSFKGENDERELDLTNYEKSLELLKSELYSMLGNDKVTDEEFIDKIKTYQDYNKKHSDLLKEIYCSK